MLDFVAIGSFSHDGLEPFSGSDALLPPNINRSRTPLFEITQLSAISWGDLPCGRQHGQVGTVQQTLDMWRERCKELQPFPLAALSLWPPIAIALLRGHWDCIAYGMPVLRKVRARKGNLFDQFSLVQAGWVRTRSSHCRLPLASLPGCGFGRVGGLKA